MHAMILSAGRGRRMGELTNNTPKPLLKVAGKYLIEYGIEQLVGAGFTEIVINVAYKAELIMATLGNGERYGALFEYSIEPQVLETGGGILQALPLLGRGPFLVVSCDIISDFPLTTLPQNLNQLAHLVVVDNPHFKPQGDFGYVDGYLDHKAEPKYTFANIGIYHPDLFAEAKPGFFPLARLLWPAIAQHKISCVHHHGKWFNIGTAEDLAEANKLMMSFPSSNPDIVFDPS